MIAEWYTCELFCVDEGYVCKLFGRRRCRVRLRNIVFLLMACLQVSFPVLAQTPNGSINGLVLDPSGKVIVAADIVIVNDATGVQYPGKTNTEGIYVVTNLPPGPYRIQVSKIGFKTLIKPDIILSVQDALAINFTLPIGAVSETVTVEGGAPLVNTESAAVSTVIDRNFVESLPLNGRSFNTLLQLTPGVVVAPTNSGFANNGGQFSISGQRTSGNNFLIDGASANFGVGPVLGQGTAGTGAAQAFSVLGGTSSLVSVEALQEFRVETSSFAPEFGRSPGGQVILTTRSGTNEFHGGVYEYFRNDVLDANDWFAKQASLPRAPERHNDFGGYLGGPIQNGKTFFFVSYEGARLRQPNTLVTTVPSEYARSTAPSPIAPFIDAYPQPQDRTITPGVYTSPFTGSFSSPSTLDAGSIRIDHTFNSRFSVFGRYNDAPSSAAVRLNALSELDTTEVDTKTLTIGAAMALSPRFANDLRANYSEQNSGFASSLDSFGGAVPPSLSLFAANLANPGTAGFGFCSLSNDVSCYATGPQARNLSVQLDIGDDLAVSMGSHQLKFGADYRAIRLDLRPGNVGLEYEVNSIQDLLATSEAGDIFGTFTSSSYFLSRSTSLYAQDAWKISPRLTLTYGVRWELDPAPSARRGTKITAWQNVNNPAALALAPFGTPVWSTTYGNFAPRVGLAYALTQNRDLVLRIGWGTFYDLGSDSAAQLGFFFPSNVSSLTRNVPLPLTNATPYIPVLSLSPPYPNDTHGFAPDLKLPRSYQWNVALEKSFAGKQAVSLTYVGQAGRDLLSQEGLNQPNSNFAGFFILSKNGAVSNYNALEAQYRRPLSGRVQALFSYTWSHSLDNASSDILPGVLSGSGAPANNYSSSDFDVRQSFSGALTFAIPGVGKSGLAAFVTKDWSLDGVIVARTGFPFSLFDVIVPPLITGNPTLYPRPDIVGGQPLWIADSSGGGGKSVNPAAFLDPAVGQEGTEHRNDIPGFGLTQIDLSIGRKFALTERVNLQFRADAFNALNHPNFANPLGFYFGTIPLTTYLQSPSMLNGGTGLGGLNPLFQEGGPRSLQLSLKLTF
jgi:TonB dependent receptor/Carboxypeptidase regulatory-like domain/TonB-dependent Receptor Plug Domain